MNAKGIYTPHHHLTAAHHDHLPLPHITNYPTPPPTNITTTVPATPAEDCTILRRTMKTPSSVRISRRRTENERDLQTVKTC